MYLEPALACLVPSTKALAYNIQAYSLKDLFTFFFPLPIFSNFWNLTVDRSSIFMVVILFQEILSPGLLSYSLWSRCLFSSSLKQLPEPSPPNLCFYPFNTFLMALFTSFSPDILILIFVPNYASCIHTPCLYLCSFPLLWTTKG